MAENRRGEVRPSDHFKDRRDEEISRIGRIVPEFREDRLREIVASPYHIVYEIDDSMKTVTVLRLWHGARGTLGPNP